MISSLPGILAGLAVAKTPVQSVCDIFIRLFQ
jgi:hypothetical protein